MQMNPLKNSPNSIEYWRNIDLTQEFMKSLKIKRNELNEALAKGDCFGSLDPLREVYRSVGIIRFIDDILENKTFELLDE